ncbi:hypothetical protein Klosneuvirus_3_295 [Klosneuvirus KNV1]|uniref:DoxX family protein n=1 Tax=Klosneuvirus KNV1 TaxID=1977640 RepID=A0A1V0SKA4_9VIRU|nr:hypothetical protein Klosneuvirus_3_295 [Klosneuvirus KNV1]
MDTKYIGKLLLVSLFIISGIYSLIYKFDDFSNAVISKGIPLAILIAFAVLLFKIIAGLVILLSKNEQYTKISVICLIIFTTIATILFHNPFTDKSQFNNMLKNVAVIGGLLLLY